MPLPNHRAKIVCTIGPASESPGVLREMLLAGMNVARLNFSHGTFAEHEQRIRALREASEATGRPLALMADLSGPKIRIGKLAEEPIQVAAGDALTLTTEEIPGDAARMTVEFERLPLIGKPGDTLYLNDGFIELRVESVEGDDVHCLVQVGGELRSRKGLNLPGVDLGISAFTPEDEKALLFALAHGVDAVSQSFVEGPGDIEAVRAAARRAGHDPFVLAKIERRSALDALDEIVEASDGLMVARGDLGVEIPVQNIAGVQKDIIFKANVAGKPVITATHMLESMTTNRRPTRAEATDVANAILDGTDAVMLSGESAIGDHPIDSVRMLAAIAAAIEGRLDLRPDAPILAGVEAQGPPSPEDLIAMSVVDTVQHAEPAALFVPTRSGETARRITRYRLAVWITAVSREIATCRALQFSYGVHAEWVEEYPEDWRAFAKNWLRRNGLDGDLVVLTEGPSRRHPDANHRMELIELAAP